MKKIISGVLVLGLLLLGSMNIFASDTLASAKAELEAAKSAAITQRAEKLGITVDELKAKMSATLEAKKAEAAAKGVDWVTYKAQLKAEREAKIAERITKIKAQTQKILAKLSAAKVQ